MVVVETAAVVGAEVATADLEVAETVVAAIAAKVARVVKMVRPGGIKVPSTQIYLLVNGRGVDYIINSDEELIFVENLPLALGKTSPPPRTQTPTTGIINEISTSSVTVLILHY